MALVTDWLPGRHRGFDRTGNPLFEVDAGSCISSTSDISDLHVKTACRSCAPSGRAGQPVPSPEAIRGVLVVVNAWIEVDAATALRVGILRADRDR